MIENEGFSGRPLTRQPALAAAPSSPVPGLAPPGFDQAQGGLLVRLADLSDTECDFIDGIAGYADGFALRVAAREGLRA